MSLLCTLLFTAGIVVAVVPLILLVIDIATDGRFSTWLFQGRI